jgi:hypothetical protein
LFDALNSQIPTKKAALGPVDVRAIQDAPSSQVLELLSARGDGLPNAEAARRESAHLERIHTPLHHGARRDR